MSTDQSALLERYHAALTGVFGRPTRVLVRGEGVHVWDADGRRYTDLLAGIAVNALGHGHPALVRAVSEQIATLGHVSNLFTSEPQIRLAERLLELAGAPAGSTVFFANSGTEANEAAFKLARRHGADDPSGRRTRVIALERAFHGRTMGALALTHKEAYRAPFEPLPGGVEHVPGGDAAALRAALAPDDDGATVAAVILEPVQGEAGVHGWPAGYLAEVRAATREAGALMILDEVQSGVGRTGTWFGFQNPAVTGAAEPVVPDAFTLAKGLGGGVPIGALVCVGPAVSRLLTAGQHGTTFGGNPLATAAGLAVLQTVQHFVGDDRTFLQAGTTFDDLTVQGAAQTFEGCAFNDAELFVQVLADLVELHLLDGQRAGVALDAVAGEDLNVDDGTLGAGRHTQGGVFDVAGLLAEDRTQQFFFWRQLGLAFWRDLADQNVASADFSTHVDDTGFVQLVQRSLTHVRDVRGDFLWAELGVARHAGQFLDMDSGKTVFLNHALREEDGVLEVVAVPRHERDAHVLTQCQLAHVGGRTVGQDVAARDHVTLAHQRTLVDAGVLVRTGVLDQVVDVHACVGGANDLFLVDLDHDAGGVDLHDLATTTSVHGHTGVTCHGTFNTGTNQRLISAQSRNRLTLHVRTHQCTVGVIVLKEWNQ